MTDFVPPDFRDSITEPHAQIIYDIAVNWSRSQYAEALDFEFLYTAVDEVARLQPDDVLALAFVSQCENRGLLYTGGGSNVILGVEKARDAAADLLERLKTLVHDRVGTIDPQHAAELYAPLFDQLFEFSDGACELQCYTTNYDRALESIWANGLESKIAVHPGLERGFRHLNPNRMLELDPTAYEAPIANDKHVVKLYKLHGSLHWIQEGASVYESPTNDYVRRNAVIYPLRKHVFVEPFKTLYMMFQQSLAKLNFLIVVGSSLRDQHLRKAMEKAMMANPGLKVIVHDPNAEELATNFGENFEKNVFPSPHNFGAAGSVQNLRTVLQEAGT